MYDYYNIISGITTLEIIMCYYNFINLIHKSQILHMKLTYYFEDLILTPNLGMGMYRQWTFGNFNS